MDLYTLSLFPEMIEGCFNTSITGRALESGLIRLENINIRDFAGNKHMKVDDYPYGGGAGLVMQAEPVYRSYEHVMKKIDKKRRDKGIKTNRPVRVVYMTPRGETFTQAKAAELAANKELVFLCGHYEGVDQRVLDTCIDEEISIGDYILTGGELAAMVLVDCVSRFIPGVLGSEESPEEESFSDGLLEYPQYTRPREWNGMEVPEVLLSGNHAKIREWRRQQSLLATQRFRPDLFEKAELTVKEKKWMREVGLCSSEN